MDSTSQETLQRISQNDHTLTMLFIDDHRNDRHNRGSTGIFNSRSRDDFSRLGKHIAKNEHLKRLRLHVNNIPALDDSNGDFYNGLRQNSSIRDLLVWDGSLIEGVLYELLKVYQDNNRLTNIGVVGATNLRNGGVNIITATLQRSTYIEMIHLAACNIADEQLLPIIDAARGLRSLTELSLNNNRIGNVGCEILSTLLDDPNSSLQTLQIMSNNISNEGAVILAKSLANNTRLKQLYIENNITDHQVEDFFSKLLCNTSSINSIHSSNHTFEKLTINDDDEGTRNGGLRSKHLQSLLLVNEIPNKRHVAIKKILKYHPNINMEPLYDWDIDGERTLKSLPYVIAWFDKAREAVDERLEDENEDEYDYQVDEKKLSAVYQFTRAMPLQFVPPAHDTKPNDDDDKKRKRVCNQG